MKTIKNYQFRLFIIRFIIIGLIGYIVEIVFTSCLSLGKSIYAYCTIENYVFNLYESAAGQVGLFAFFVYCWAAIPFTFLTNPLKKLIKNNLLFPNFGIFLRGLIFGLIFMLIEFIIGMFLLLFHIRAWDYSNLPLNVFGVITFAFLPAWTVAGILGEWIHDRLLQIDDILLNPEGYDDKGLRIGFRKYEEFHKQKQARKKH
ncbi:MAG: hypothetical protein JXJ04_25475 [Spirochaetales bacterium]|nr:hypothetical protein [Spirochaetales bacterium]